MTKNFASQSPMPQGCEPYGTPRGDISISAITPSHIQPGTEMAPPSGIEFDYGYPPCTAIRTDGIPCTARRVSGGEVCRGHRNQEITKAKKASLSAAADIQTGQTMAIPFENANLTLAQMRDFISQLSGLTIGQGANDDISTDVVNGFVKEGFQKIVALSTRFPYYQATATFPTVVDQHGYSSFAQTLPTVGAKTIDDFAQIISVVNITNSGNYLIYLDQFKAEGIWVGTNDLAGIPVYFTIWADEINLWPKPDSVYTIVIRGYRIPLLTWLQDDGANIDIDPEMQLPLTNYVMARIFQFQEDGEMAAIYMKNFEQGIALHTAKLTAPNSNQPLIMSGGLQLNTSTWYGNAGVQVLPHSPSPIGVMY